MNTLSNVLSFFPLNSLQVLGISAMMMVTSRTTVGWLSLIFLGEVGSRVWVNSLSIQSVQEVDSGDVLAIETSYILPLCI